MKAIKVRVVLLSLVTEARASTINSNAVTRRHVLSESASVIVLYGVLLASESHICKIITERQNIKNNDNN